MSVSGPTSNHPLVFISAAEPSADMHGAALIRALTKRCPDARFVGVAGPHMVAQGCWPIFDMTRHSAMLLSAVGAAGRAIRMMITSERHLRRYPFDAAVVIDSPTLHLPLAARAKAAAIPVMYYIAPQLWAWGAQRIHKVRARVDRLAVILPFEEAFFRNQGVDATFVGHPLADRIVGCPIDETVRRGIRDRGGPVVALLPGSRRHVVTEVLPGQLEVAERIMAEVPTATFGVSVANEQVAPIIESAVKRSVLAVTRYPDHRTELVRAADLVLVASGTMALEVAMHRRPMIVMYNASRLFYHLVGRWVVKTPHLSLPNILAGRRIVPEFMPFYTSTAPIARQAIDLLRNEQMQAEMIESLTAVTEPLRQTGAADRAADVLLKMIEESQRR